MFDYRKTKKNKTKFKRIFAKFHDNDLNKIKNQRKIVKISNIIKYVILNEINVNVRRFDVTNFLSSKRKKQFRRFE